MVRYLPLNASAGLFNELMLLFLCSTSKGVQQQFLFTGRGCSTFIALWGWSVLRWIFWRFSLRTNDSLTLLDLFCWQFYTWAVVLSQSPCDFWLFNWYELNTLISWSICIQTLRCIWVDGVNVVTQTSIWHLGIETEGVCGDLLSSQAHISVFWLSLGHSALVSWPSQIERWGFFSIVPNTTL